MIQCWMVSNPALRTVIDTMPSYELVGVPIGRDSKHCRFWNFGDLRLYKETPATKTKESEWETVCVEPEEWVEALRLYESSSSQVEKQLAKWIQEVLPGVLEVLEKREVAKRREEFERENPELLAKRPTKAKEKESVNEEEKRLKYMREEEERLRVAEAALREIAEAERIAEEARVAAEEARKAEEAARKAEEAVAINTLTEEEIRLAVEELQRAKEEERRRDREHRKARKLRREEELAHQAEYDGRKAEWDGKMVRHILPPLCICCNFYTHTHACVESNDHSLAMHLHNGCPQVLCSRT